MDLLPLTSLDRHHPSSYPHRMSSYPSPPTPSYPPPPFAAYDDPLGYHDPTNTTTSSHYDEPTLHAIDRGLSQQWSTALFRLEHGQQPWDPAPPLDSAPATNTKPAAEYDPALSLSPASNRSSFTSISSTSSSSSASSTSAVSVNAAAATLPGLSPSLSPLDLRSPRDLPRLPRTHATPDTTLPSLPSLQAPDYDPVQTEPYPPKPDPKPSKIHDPDAARFLQDRLGPSKWATFSARLFDKRLATSRARRAGGDDADDVPGGGHGGSNNNGALSVYSFLVKVEAVKEVLRTLVPHPYNPEKTADHPYARSAKGYVRLTRETVLQLAGWSNTQFSYWMRRVEAIAVFAPHDATLRAMKAALLGMLYPPPPSSSPGMGAQEIDAREVPHITGKGLDALVDDIKRRTGSAPFLRGKHASLDAFCAAERADLTSPSAAAAASATSSNSSSTSTLSPSSPANGLATSPLLTREGLGPTFHAQMYSHEQRVAEQAARRKRKRAAAEAHETDARNGPSTSASVTNVNAAPFARTASADSHSPFGRSSVDFGRPWLGGGGDMADEDAQPVGRIAYTNSSSSNNGNNGNPFPDPRRASFSGMPTTASFGPPFSSSPTFSSPTTAFSASPTFSSNPPSAFSAGSPPAFSNAVFSGSPGVGGAGGAVGFEPYAFPVSHARGPEGVHTHTHKRVRTIG